MRFNIENDVENLQSLTTSVSGQLDELYNKLSTVVTAVATLNSELDELPQSMYLHDLIGDLNSLHHVLNKVAEPALELPNADSLRNTTEAANELAAELRCVRELWELLPSDDEIEHKVQALNQCEI